MNKTTGRAGVAPSREQDEERCARCSLSLEDEDDCVDPDCPYHPADTGVRRCAGCGATLPPGEAIVFDVMAADVRCDLCWRSLLAGEAAHWRHEQTDAVGPQGEKRDDH